MGGPAGGAAGHDRAEGVEVGGVHLPPWATHDDVAEGGEGEAGEGRHTAAHQVL